MEFLGRGWDQLNEFSNAATATGIVQGARVAGEAARKTIASFSYGIARQSNPLNSNPKIPPSLHTSTLYDSCAAYLTASSETGNDLLPANTKEEEREVGEGKEQVRQGALKLGRTQRQMFAHEVQWGILAE